MGAEVGYALAAISIGATISKAGAEKKAEQANIEALNQQSKLLSLQYQQKHMQNLDLIDKMLSRQAAQLSTRGVAFDSPSFNAIQRDTVNSVSKRQKNLDTEEAISQQMINIEKRNVKTTLHSQLFGDAVNLAFSSAGFLDKVPKTNAPSKLAQIEDL